MVKDNTNLIEEELSKALLSQKFKFSTNQKIFEYHFENKINQKDLITYELKYKQNELNEQNISEIQNIIKNITPLEFLDELQTIMINKIKNHNLNGTIGLNIRKGIKCLSLYNYMNICDYIEENFHDILKDNLMLFF